MLPHSDAITVALLSHKFFSLTRKHMGVFRRKDMLKVFPAKRAGDVAADVWRGAVALDRFAGSGADGRGKRRRTAPTPTVAGVSEERDVVRWHDASHELPDEGAFLGTFSHYLAVLGALCGAYRRTRRGSHVGRADDDQTRRRESRSNSGGLRLVEPPSFTTIDLLATLLFGMANDRRAVRVSAADLRRLLSRVARAASLRASLVELSHTEAEAEEEIDRFFEKEPLMSLSDFATRLAGGEWPAISEGFGMLRTLRDLLLFPSIQNTLMAEPRARRRVEHRDMLGQRYYVLTGDSLLSEYKREGDEVPTRVWALCDAEVSVSVVQPTSFFLTAREVRSGVLEESRSRVRIDTSSIESAHEWMDAIICSFTGPLHMLANLGLADEVRRVCTSVLTEEELAVALNCVDVYGLTALHAAVRPELQASDRMNVKVANALIEQYRRAPDANANVADSNGYTVLHSAGLADDELLQALLSVRGISVNARNLGGNTPLHFFCAKFRSPNCGDTLRVFVRKGADVNVSNSSGEAPLHNAVFNNVTRIIMARELIDQGADVNAQTKRGDTALHRAVHLGRDDLVKLLLSEGAAVDVQDGQGNTPLDLATTYGHEHIAKLLVGARELVAWLSSKKMLQYAKLFVREELFLDEVPELDKTALERLGVKKPEHRERLARACAALAAKGWPGSGKETPSPRLGSPGRSQSDSVLTLAAEGEQGSSGGSGSVRNGSTGPRKSSSAKKKGRRGEPKDRDTSGSDASPRTGDGSRKGSRIGSRTGSRTSRSGTNARSSKSAADLRVSTTSPPTTSRLADSSDSAAGSGTAAPAAGDSSAAGSTATSGEAGPVTSTVDGTKKVLPPTGAASSSAAADGITPRRAKSAPRPPSASLGDSLPSSSVRSKLAASTRVARLPTFTAQSTLMSDGPATRDPRVERLLAAVGRSDESSSSIVIAGDKIEYTEELGSGSAGQVFKGLLRTEAGDDFTCAIKVLKDKTSESELSEFTKEFRILNQLEDPALVTFYGVSVEPQLALIMEYCERGSLHDILSDNAVSIGWSQVLEWAYQSARGVACLHQGTPPIFHRDLKPGNLLVTHDWHIRLCDFGLSRMSTASNMETLGQLRGTMAYSGPESYFGEIFTSAGDIYSYGVILWEMVTRVIKQKYERPYQEFPHLVMDFQIIIQVAKNQLRPTIPPTTPAAVRDLITECWAQKPDDRLGAPLLMARVKKLQEAYDAASADWDATLQPEPLTDSEESSYDEDEDDYSE
jgi:ankyrin repeat protein